MYQMADEGLMWGYRGESKEWFSVGLDSPPLLSPPASFMFQPQVDLPADPDGAVCLGCPLQDVPPPQHPTLTKLYSLNWFQGAPSHHHHHPSRLFCFTHTCTDRQPANNQCPKCTQRYTRLALCAVNANSIWDAGVWLTADLQSVLPYAPHTHWRTHTHTP